MAITAMVTAIAMGTAMEMHTVTAIGMALATAIVMVTAKKHTKKNAVPYAWYSLGFSVRTPKPSAQIIPLDVGGTMMCSIWASSRHRPW
jgi:hypothetical protein